MINTDSNTVWVLGSAAGGGFPQWNCRCKNCSGIRKGTLKGKRRTQSSLMVSLPEKDNSWVLINASPDIRAQWESFPFLHSPDQTALRSSNIDSIILMDAQIDHTAGLLFLREGGPLSLFCTDAVFSELTKHHPILNILDFYCGYQRRTISFQDGVLTTSFSIGNLLFTAIPVASNAPPFSPFRDHPLLDHELALKITNTLSGRSLFFAPSILAFDDNLLQMINSCDFLLVDGTFWEDHELKKLGISQRSSREMGHLPLWGEGGLLETYKKISGPQIFLTHINNTNPILDENSYEHNLLQEFNISLAYDGLKLEL